MILLFFLLLASPLGQAQPALYDTTTATTTTTEGKTRVKINAIRWQLLFQAEGLEKGLFIIFLNPSQKDYKKGPFLTLSYCWGWGLKALLLNDYQKGPFLTLTEHFIHRDLS